MPHFMIVVIPDINLLNLSWIKNCLFFRNMEPLIRVYSKRKEFAPLIRKFFILKAKLCHQALPGKGSLLKRKQKSQIRSRLLDSNLFPFQIDKGWM